MTATTTTQAGRALLATVLSDAMRLPQLAAVERALFEDRFRRPDPVVARAVARGELPAETDPAELLQALAAPICFRLVFTGEPVDEATADRAVGGTIASGLGGLPGTGRRECAVTGLRGPGRVRPGRRRRWRP
ncbi:TetR-like C-terminal domain-containing protein [Streptomyces sp. NPDC007369]|uniref:TetR-like C-terminal domain-containing protein n=1 Tax=Streptomyces sp. NPDC007369 TaxID=3154589 RepID=UPI0033FB5A4A